jgi:WD40 repeat protein
VSIWDIEKGELANSAFQHWSMVSDLALTADGKTLASASGDKTIILWALN